jgi:hypothetical protein
MTLNRRIDLFEKTLVQHVLKFATYIETQQGARQHPSRQFVFEHLNGATSGSAADSESRMSLTQRVEEIERRIVRCEHLPPDLTPSQAIEMQTMALESQLPWARAQAFTVSQEASQPRSLACAPTPTARESTSSMRWQVGSDTSQQLRHLEPSSLSLGSPLSSRPDGAGLGARRPKPALPKLALHLSSRRRRPESSAASASQPSPLPVMK